MTSVHQERRNISRLKDGLGKAAEDDFAHVGLWP